ncbi:retropepsin-like aspartic protease [Brevundimonas sp.]|uniref:retropepsin-like aspartic protease n=1 Tax=Brevundimonas sp. TaxID=1871086 RepID=UPI0035AE7FBA
MLQTLILSLAAVEPTCAAAFETLRTDGAVDAAYVAHVAFVRADPGDGEPRWFLVDTGANRSALDAAVARALNLPDEGGTTVEGTGGVVEVSSTTVPRFTLGPVTTRLSPTVSDLSGLAGPEGAPVAGILGSDLFGQRVLTLDFERNRLALSAAGEASAAAAACGRSAPMGDDNGIPRVTGELDGRPVELRYDSGAGLFDDPHLWINLSQPQHAAILDGRDAGEPLEVLGGSGTGGSVRLPVYAAGRFRLGGIEWAEPRLIVQPPQGYFARPEAVGFIGNAAFRPFGLVVVDYPGGRLTVPPAA